MTMAEIILVYGVEYMFKKKAWGILVIVVLLGLLAGCSGISKESFGIEYNGKMYCVGNVISENDPLYSSKGFAGEKTFKIQFPDNNVIYQIGTNGIFDGPQIKTLCGIQTGDSVQRVIEKFGRNLAFDKILNDSSIDTENGNYNFQYAYYMEGGQLHGISDRVRYPITYRMNEKEQAYYDSISYKLDKESYYVEFYISKGRVVSINFAYFHL